MRYLIVLVMAFLCHLGIAQQNLLEKSVSLQVKDVRLATALAKLKSQYGFAFSYSNNLIPLDKKVSVQIKDRPLQEVLSALFEDTPVTFIQVGNHIVLQKSRMKRHKSPTGAKSLDMRPKAKLETSETEKTDNPPAPMPTSEYLPVPELGSYEDAAKATNPGELKREYESERRNLEKNFLAQLDVAIESGDSITIARLKQEFRDFSQALKTDYQRISKRISAVFLPESTVDTVKEARIGIPIQVSIIPPLSTNGKENENMVNHFSLNLPVGYSGGLDGVELGWLANIEKGNVSGVQVSGFTNLVRGNVDGVQYAGFLNWQSGRLEGVQVAGCLNISGSDSSNVFQVAGFANTHPGDLYGGQISGFLNANGGYVIGSQVAGFLNLGKGPISGVQIAGFANINKGNMHGAQVSGFMNVGRNTLGSQVAGFLNVNKLDIKGSQVGGFLNVAGKVHGSQIGVINISDTVSGVQIGLINYARKGYRRLEVFGSETIRANMAFKMGNRSFHNIFLAGINPGEEKPKWSYGFGFGMEKELSKHFLLNLDLICNQIIENESIIKQDLNLINQFKVLIGYKPARRTSIFAGPTVNVAVSRVVNKESGKIGTDLIPGWAPFRETFGPTTVALWVGGNVGIRF